MACRIVSLGFSTVCRSRLFLSQTLLCQNLKNGFSQNYRLMSSDSLDMKIKSCDSTESLLHVVQDHNLSGNQASLSLTRIAQLQNMTQVDQFTSDSVLQELCTKIASEKYNISTESLVLSLINICRIQTEPAIQLICILEPECRRRLRVMQIRHLIFLIANHNVLLAVNSDSVNRMVAEAAAVLESRLKDIFEVKNLTQLLIHSPAVSKTLPQKLQQHMSTLMDYFSFSDLTQFCKAMLAGKFPTGVLLRTMSVKMASVKEEWTVEHVLQVLKCFQGIGFNNRNVVIAFSNYLQSQIKDCSLSDVLDIAQVYSSLRISNKELLTEVENFVSRQIGSVPFRDLRCVLKVFFVLQFVPSDEFVEVVTKELLEGWSDLKPYLQLEIAWCLMGLDKLPALLLDRVVLLNSADFNPALLTKHQHLLNYAKIEPSTTHLIPTTSLHSTVTSDVNLRPVQQSVKKILDDVIIKKHLSTNILTPVGHVIDFELLLDEQQNTVDTQSEEVSTRLAILVHGSTSYLYADDAFVGPVTLKRKQLIAAGYELVEIGFREWNTMKSEVEKKQFIKRKLAI